MEYFLNPDAGFRIIITSDVSFPFTLEFPLREMREKLNLDRFGAHSTLAAPSDAQLLDDIQKLDAKERQPLQPDPRPLLPPQPDHDDEEARQEEIEDLKEDDEEQGDEDSDEGDKADASEDVRPGGQADADADLDGLPASSPNSEPPQRGSTPSGAAPTAKKPSDAAIKEALKKGRPRC